MTDACGTSTCMTNENTPNGDNETTNIPKIGNLYNTEWKFPEILQFMRILKLWRISCSYTGV